MVLIAHSWSAALALDFATQFSGLIDSLVLVSPWVYARPQDKPNQKALKLFKTPLFSKLLSRSLGRKAIRTSLAECFYPQPLSIEYEHRVLALYSKSDQLIATLEDKEALLREFPRLETIYSNIRIPTFIISGDSDRVTPFESQATRLSKQIKGSKLVIAKGDGHALPQMPSASLVEVLK